MTGSKTCASTASPLNYVEFAGIHTDPSLRFGGNRISKLDVRSDDRTSQTDGLSGCRSCSPHSLLRSGKDQVHPAAHSKQLKGLAALAWADPDAECVSLFIL